MTCITATMPGEFRRLPGFYRRWELAQVCAANRSYRIEDAGHHADGTPLLAIYVDDGDDATLIPVPGPVAGSPQASAVADV